VERFFFFFFFANGESNASIAYSSTSKMERGFDPSTVFVTQNKSVVQISMQYFIFVPNRLGIAPSLKEN
jgi:hypothetical protein